MKIFGSEKILWLWDVLFGGFCISALGIWRDFREFFRLLTKYYVKMCALKGEVANNFYAFQKLFKIVQNVKVLIKEAKMRYLTNLDDAIHCWCHCHNFLCSFSDILQTMPLRGYLHLRLVLDVDEGCYGSFLNSLWLFYDDVYGYREFLQSEFEQIFR